jgi:hypothetical protein
VASYVDGEHHVDVASVSTRGVLSDNLVISMVDIMLRIMYFV